MSGEPFIGIDLGTTHTVVALFDDAGARVIANARGTSLIPSVVAVDSAGTVLVGELAVERQLSGDSNTVSRFKSSMGTEETFELGERRLSATALSALVLRHVCKMASSALGVPIDRAVVSVPAWFREPQRAATIEAAHLAGLEVTRLVNEPTAAALHYGMTAGPDPQNIAVLDLGGGTFDISLIEFFDGIADVRASIGDVALGGEDATDSIVRWVRDQLSVVPFGHAGASRLRDVAERAKRRLSQDQQTELTIGDSTLVLTRPEFEELVSELSLRMQRCLGELRAQRGYVRPDTVLLVGGAARMPWVEKLAKKHLEQTVEAWSAGDTAIALGASIQAGLAGRHAALRDVLMSDVLTHSLGVSTSREVQGVLLGDRFDPILSRGTTLPASRISRYHTLHHEQTCVAFQIYEGEQREASQNHPLGSLKIDGLRPLSEGESHDLEVRFTHDVSGVLEVQARVVGHETWETLVLQRSGLKLGDDEAAQRLEALLPLKTLPADLLPNRWVLERASRVVSWITGVHREHLERAIDRFEAALIRNEPGGIDSARRQLESQVQEVVEHFGLEVDP